MRDYKERIQAMADKLAFEEFGKDFYDILADKQDRVWLEAETEVRDQMLAAADIAKDYIGGKV